MAKGNLAAYNLSVIGITFLCSLLIYLIAGSAVVFSLIVIGYIVNGVLPAALDEQWGRMVYVCMISLAAVVGLFSFFAVVRNIRLRYGLNEKEFDQA